MKDNLVKTPDGPAIDIDLLDRDGLLALHVTLSKKSAEIRAQLDRAEESRTRADATWMASTRSALAITSVQLNRIQLRLSRLKAERRAEHFKTIAHHIRDEHLAFLHVFFREARSRLGEQEFKSLCEVARVGQADVTCEKCGQAAAKE